MVHSGTTKGNFMELQTGRSNPYDVDVNVQDGYIVLNDFEFEFTFKPIPYGKAYTLYFPPPRVK